MEGTEESVNSKMKQYQLSNWNNKQKIDVKKKKKKIPETRRPLGKNKRFNITRFPEGKGNRMELKSSKRNNV